MGVKGKERVGKRRRSDATITESGQICTSDAEAAERCKKKKIRLEARERGGSDGDGDGERSGGRGAQKKGSEGGDTRQAASLRSREGEGKGKNKKTDKKNFDRMKNKKNTQITA